MLQWRPVKGVERPGNLQGFSENPKMTKRQVLLTKKRFALLYPVAGLRRRYLTPNSPLLILCCL